MKIIDDGFSFLILLHLTNYWHKLSNTLSYSERNINYVTHYNTSTSNTYIYPMSCPAKVLPQFEQKRGYACLFEDNKIGWNDNTVAEPKNSIA